jgi:hypothetical protein
MTSLLPLRGYNSTGIYVCIQIVPFVAIYNRPRDIRLQNWSIQIVSSRDISFRRRHIGAHIFAGANINYRSMIDVIPRTGLGKSDISRVTSRGGNELTSRACASISSIWGCRWTGIILSQQGLLSLFIPFCTAVFIKRDKLVVSLQSDISHAETKLTTRTTGFLVNAN